MAIISVPNTFSANTTISSSEVNANFSTIYNEFNGSIAAANLATDSVVAAKIASSAVTTAKIADDAVTAAKIDWGATGTNGGIWWEELGRTTLSVAGDAITVSSLPARRYLRIIANITATGGTHISGLRFNNDSGSNYAHRFSDGGGADTTQVSQTSAVFRLGAVPSGGNSLCVAEVSNVATLEKHISVLAIGTITATGAGTAPQRLEGSAKWANTSDQISRVDIVNTGTGDFAIGSEVVVLGHD